MHMTDQKTANHINNKNDYRRAKKLRQSMPPAELIMWEQLRLLPKELALKFRRQHPVHPYVTDFACVSCKLIVELDGPSHDATAVFDEERSRYLNHMGYTVIRFKNDDVYNNCEGVVQMIVHEAEKLIQSLRSTPPLAPPQGEEDYSSC